MQNEQELPLGFKKLSDRYPMFPILLGGGKSLQSLEPRAKWKWKLWAWIVDQIEEARDKNLPLWLARSNTWELVLIDGRRFLLTDDEKEAYMEHLRVHDLAMQWSHAAQIMQNQYKTGRQ